MREDRAEAAHRIDRLEAVFRFGHHIGRAAEVGLGFESSVAKRLGNGIGSGGLRRRTVAENAQRDRNTATPDSREAIRRF